jgi:hypothetical protein
MSPLDPLEVLDATLLREKVATMAFELQHLEFKAILPDPTNAAALKFLQVMFNGLLSSEKINWVPDHYQSS